MSYRTQLKELPADKKQRVLWLHHQAFGGDTACKQCKGACCDTCAMANGYLPLTYNDPKLHELKAKYNWDNDAGFQGEHGCNLPLSERSGVCLGFQCSGVVYQTNENGARMPNRTPRINKPFTKAQHEAAREIGDIFWHALKEMQ